jgi:hypothetical protein
MCNVSGGLVRLDSQVSAQPCGQVVYSFIDGITVELIYQKVYIYNNGRGYAKRLQM